jgi:hypothetical protein
LHNPMNLSMLIGLNKAGFYSSNLPMSDIPEPGILKPK